MLSVWKNWKPTLNGLKLVNKQHGKEVPHTRLIKVECQNFDCYSDPIGFVLHEQFPSLHLYYSLASGKQLPIIKERELPRCGGFYSWGSKFIRIYLQAEKSSYQYRKQPHLYTLSTFLRNLLPLLKLAAWQMSSQVYKSCLMLIAIRFALFEHSYDLWSKYFDSVLSPWSESDLGSSRQVYPHVLKRFNHDSVCDIEGHHCRALSSAAQLRPQSWDNPSLLSMLVRWQDRWIASYHRFPSSQGKTHQSLFLGADMLVLLYVSWISQHLVISGFWKTSGGIIKVYMCRAASLMGKWDKAAWRQAPSLAR